MRHFARASAAFLALLLAAPAAAALDLEGALEQGGLALGRAAPGSQVRLDGMAVRVAEDGRFVLGFGRDARPAAILEVILPDGQRESRTLAIAGRDWPVQRIDGLPPAKVTPDKQALQRIRAEARLITERRRRDSPQPGFAAGFSPPAAGVVSGVFGSQRILNGEPRAPHSGTDIAAASGTPVSAAADGTVSLAESDLYFTGMTVMIDHGHGLSSVYAHLSRIDVAEGARVRRGETIGRVGASGRATGPHLHWGVSWFQEKLDPQTVLQHIPGRP